MGETTPSWMNAMFLDKVLQSVEETKEKLYVISFQCEAAVPPGSNYLSQVYRVTAVFKTEKASKERTVSLIVKIPLESGWLKEWVDRNKGFEKEIKVYDEILPKMYEVHSLRLTPKSFYCPLNNSLVLEDLRASGYNMADRLKQLDFQHSQHLMMTLAKLHALSVAAYHRHPQLLQTAGTHMMFNKHVSLDEQRNLQTLCKNFLRAFAKAIENLNNCKSYAERIYKKIDNFWDRMVQLYESKEGLNVLIHGDAWTTNLMYKYNNAGEVVDLKLVDFQLSQFCSFAIDILFFWCTSASNDVRENHRETIFESYRLTLNESLHDLGCVETLSKEEFDHQIRMAAPYSFYVMSTVTATAMSDPDDLVVHDTLSQNDFTKDFDENEPQWKSYKSKYYKAVLPNMLRQVEVLGAFD